MPTLEAPSENTPPRSRAPMQLVAEKVSPDTLSGLVAATTAAQTTSTPKAPTVSRETGEYVHRAAWKAGVLGAVNVLLIVLAVRLTLLVAVAGAIYLTIVAANAPDPYRLGAVGIYTLLVVGPMVWLASRK
jgi:hypothetical protein